MASRKLKLKCMDGVTMEVEEMVALEWLTIKQSREDNDDDSDVVIPISITSEILLKVIEYSKKHLDTTSNSDHQNADSNLKAWDAEFVNVDVNTLYHLIMVRFFYLFVFLFFFLFFLFVVKKEYRPRNLQIPLKD